jgi:hypothetical protein
MKQIKPQLNIVYRNWGISDKFNDGTIELNKHLDKYPKLKRSILAHELNHTNRPGFTRKDFIHDISSPDKIDMFALMTFVIKHPRSWIQFLPFYYHKQRGMVFDANMIIVYSTISVVILIALGIGFYI